MSETEKERTRGRVRVSVCGRDRLREGMRGTDKQTNRQTDRQTDRRSPVLKMTMPLRQAYSVGSTCISLNLEMISCSERISVIIPTTFSAGDLSVEMPAIKKRPRAVTDPSSVTSKLDPVLAGDVTHAGTDWRVLASLTFHTSIAPMVISVTHDTEPGFQVFSESQ